MDDSNEFIIREIFLKKTDAVDGEERIITQFHMINWPDHGWLFCKVFFILFNFFIMLGVPDNIDPIIEMLDCVHSKLNESSNGEDQYLVTHCSAGCGRTGTIIALDYCWNLIKAGKLPNDFSPFSIGKMLRRQRTAMIQTFVCQCEFLFNIVKFTFFFPLKDQYKMFYESLGHLINKKFMNNINNSSCSLKNYTNDNRRINDEAQDDDTFLNSKKGSSKKNLDSARPSSSSSVKVQSNHKLSHLTNTRALSANSVKSGILSNINDNLPKLFREPTTSFDINNNYSNIDYNNNNFSDTSQESFDFKPIPSDKFNENFKIMNQNQQNENNFIAKDVDQGIDDDDDEEEEEESFDPKIDSKLFVPGVGESIFGGQLSNLNNISVSKLKRNSPVSKLKFENENSSTSDRKQTSSATSTGSIKEMLPQLTDLKKENPPKIAQISTNYYNPSPPVSARHNYDSNKSGGQLDGNSIQTKATPPNPPPRNKHRKNLVNDFNNTELFSNSNSSSQNIQYDDHLV